MLIDQIKKANIEAMKAHDKDARTAYSLVISSYQNLLTSGKGNEVSDADVVKIITKFSKELDEEGNTYLQANRKEEYEAILRQKEAIVKFLPKMLNEEEIKEIISKLDDKSIPSVMKHFKMNYNGKCDMGLVNKVLKGL
ncbi:MAG TPA: hypothetical protein DEF61_04280 [Firmicutes bacterium]|nr:hypothetical protein [Bacillota bacterium]